MDVPTKLNEVERRRIMENGRKPTHYLVSAQRCRVVWNVDKPLLFSSYANLVKSATHDPGCFGWSTNGDEGAFSSRAN